jgi:Cof subfamily protein (haloacid dehalogenase superfamily)
MEARRRFSLVALDIDGTLMSDSKVIPRFTSSEIARSQREYGARYCLISARMPASVEVVRLAIGACEYFAAYNGALIMRAGAETPDIIEERRLPPDVVAEAQTAARTLAVHLGVFSRDTWVVSSIDYWALREARGCRIWPDSSMDAIGHDTEPISAEHVNKLMFRGDARQLDLLERQFASRAANVWRSTKTTLELTPQSVDKAHALRIICRLLQIDIDHVMAIGDSISDICMLDAAGWGVAVGNAPDSVRTQCNEVTLSNNEDGVGLILRKYFPSDRRLLDPS